MPESRSQTREEHFEAPPERLFEILTKPSAIRGWWGASIAIVIPEKGGVWAAVWGSQDDPDYVSVLEIAEFDPPRRVVMNSGKYLAKSGPLPFKFADDASTAFTVEPKGSGSILRVEQSGFPCDPAADDFYAACGTGWKNTFNGIREYLNDSRRKS